MDLAKAKSELNEFLTDHPSLWGCAMIPNPVGPKEWIVQRDNDTPWPRVHIDARGKTIRYSEEGALKKAKELNNQELEAAKIRDSMVKGAHVRSLLELQETIEKKTSSIVYRIRNGYLVDPELSRDLSAAVDAFLQKAEERINRGQN